MLQSKEKYFDIANKGWNKFTNIKIKNISLIPKGFKNSSLLIEDANNNKFVLKVYAPNFLNDVIIEEYSKIQYKLLRNKIPVIELIKGKDERFLQIVNYKGNQYQITISKFIELTSIDEKQLTKYILEEIAATLANLHVQLRKVKSVKDARVFKPIETLKIMLSEETIIKIKDYFGDQNLYRKSNLDNYINDYINNGLRIMQYFERRKDMFSEIQLIHGDFQISNLNIENNSVRTVFDFDEMTMAPITFEIGCSLVHLDEGVMLTEDLIECYTESYSKFRKLSKVETEDILMFMQYRAFYRISRWFTYYRFLEGDGVHFAAEHFIKYQHKLDKYKSIDPEKVLILSN